MPVASIPGKMEVDWDPVLRSMVDVWTNYCVTAAEFRSTIMVAALEVAKRKGAHAWIVDSSRATSAFPAEVQQLIEKEAFHALARAGIKYFITIAPASALTKMTVKSYSAKAGPSGIQLVEVPSRAEAEKFLRAHP